MENPNLHLPSPTTHRPRFKASSPSDDPNTNDDEGQSPASDAVLLPEYLQRLLEGSGVCGDSRAPFEKPAWYDDAKFKLGQELSNEYSFGVVYAHMVSLLMIFAFESGLQPLLYTGKSSSPLTAFKRYLSTVVRVKSWSETDIWEPGSEGNKNLKLVRGMHESVRRAMSAEPAGDLEKKLNGEDKPRWVDLHKEITDSWKASCPMARHVREGPKHVYVSQTDMAVTQFGFVGLILLFPHKFGIHHASREEFEGYAHFWRTISYLLGVEDRFNLCDGDLDTVMQRCRDLVRCWAVPRLLTASHDWMHMSRCMCEGVGYYMQVGTSFELVLYYLCHVLDVATPRLKSLLTVGQLLMFHVTRFLYVYATRCVAVLHFLNFILKLVIEKGQEISQTPDFMRDLEKRVYPYVKS